MSDHADDRAIEELDVDACIALLAEVRFGRIAYARSTGVEVIPVNAVFDAGAVVFRTTYGERLDELASGVQAVFESDDVDADRGTGWSVVVRGQTEEVWSPDELDRLRALPLRPLAPGRREHFVRLLPQRITGRRISPA